MTQPRLSDRALSGLISGLFGLSREEFFVTGSCVLRSYGDVGDYDFVVTPAAFDRIKASYPWGPSRYFKDSYKLEIDALSFNAIVLDGSDFIAWNQATELYASCEDLTKLDKLPRLRVFSQFLAFFGFDPQKNKILHDNGSD